VRHSYLFQLSIAGISYLYDRASAANANEPAERKKEPKKKHWLMRADPCFMTPDRDQLILAETNPELSHDEAQQLILEINQFYNNISQEQFWHLEFITPERWYIISDKPIEMYSSPPEIVQKQSVKSFLYQGKQSQHWINLANEFQMILHQSSVNKTRLEQGKIPVNSIWFWGAGESLNHIQDHSDNYPAETIVYTDNTIARGLCYLNDDAHHPVPQSYQPSDQSQRVIYIIDDFMPAIKDKDIFTWVGLLQQFEKQYLIPLLESLRSGKIAEVHLISPTGTQLFLTKKLVNRWWRRIKPYHTLL